MQKISSYLYPNRIELIADLAGFNVEYTKVYQKIVKIYNGIDNVIEFDIKNADQKRVDLTTISMIELNVMDSAGTALSNSPYTITPTALKGIGTVVIPQEDLCELGNQFLTYSVTAIKDNNDVILYSDSRFGATGTIELVGNALPTFRDETVYKTFIKETQLNGIARYHTSAIPAFFVEAEPTEALQFIVEMTGFIGTVWLEGTEHSVISSESFTNAVRIQTITFTTPNSTPLVWDDVPVGDYKYFRVYYQGDNPLTPTGKVTQVRVDPAICIPYNVADGGSPNDSYGYNIIDGGAV